MKKIIIPNNFTYKTEEIQQVAKFKDFLLGNTLSDPRFGQSLELLRMCKKLREESTNLKEGQEWLIDDREAAMMKEITHNPSRMYDINLAMQFLPYMEAIVNCLDVEPAAPIEEPAAP